MLQSQKNKLKGLAMMAPLTIFCLYLLLIAIFFLDMKMVLYVFAFIVLFVVSSYLFDKGWHLYNRY